MQPTHTSLKARHSTTSYPQQPSSCLVHKPAPTLKTAPPLPNSYSTFKPHTLRLMTNYVLGSSSTDFSSTGDKAAPSPGTRTTTTAADDYKNRWGIALTQGPRDTMEDVAQVKPSAPCSFLFASVFDGHGGDAAAQYLEKNFFNVVSEALKRQAGQFSVECSISQAEEGLCCPIELHSAVAESFREADDNLLKWLSTSVKGDNARSGCTATTLLVRPDVALVANVGDSRAVLSRRGKAMDLTTEHRVWGKGNTVTSETERIESAGGWVEDGRVCGVLAVSRAFGDPDFKGVGLKALLQRGVEDEFWTQEFADSQIFTEDPVTVVPDVFELTLQSGKDEVLIVATDGLWDVVSSQDAVSLARAELRRGGNAEGAAEKLIDAAVKRRTQDNVAVIVVDLLGPEGWKKISENNNGGGKGLFGLFGR